MNNFKETIKNILLNKEFKSLNFKIEDIICTITYHKTLSDVKTYNKYFVNKITTNNISYLDKVYPGVYFKITCLDSEIISLVSMGFMLFEANEYLYYINMQSEMERSISESLIEPHNILGARDGFVENINKNIGLIQRRIKCTTFVNEEIVVGKRSKTKVSILYLSDVCNKETIRQITDKINSINVDGLISINDITYLFTKNSLFPLCGEIGSPELAAMNIYEGRAVILVDQIPIAVCVPVDFDYFLTLKEGYYTTPIITFHVKLILFILLFISVFFLGIYAAVINYHTNIVSLVVVSQIKSSFKGTTLPLFIEFLFIIFLFDTLRIASTRSPSNNIQNIIAIVGGLLIGQNAVNSGFISAFNLVVTAICYLSSFAISNNQRFIQAISITRIIVLLCGLFLGLFGVLVIFILIMYYLINLRSLNSSYLAPIIPYYQKDFKQIFFTKHIFKRKTRSRNLMTNDNTRGN